MRKLIMSEWMSLDGVLQSPSYSDEDPSGGFAHGGWHSRYFEPRAMEWCVETVTRAGGYLFGRRTYEVFAAHWPHASPEEQVFAGPLNSRPKYVASRTLRAPLAWHGATLLEGSVVDAVAALKQEPGDDLVLIGSTELAAELLAHDLVDELRLMIDPVILGGGKRFFRDDGAYHPLALAKSETTSTGAILATYVRSSAAAEAAPPLPRPPHARG